MILQISGKDGNSGIVNGVWKWGEKVQCSTSPVRSLIQQMPTSKISKVRTCEEADLQLLTPGIRQVTRINVQRAELTQFCKQRGPLNYSNASNTCHGLHARADI